MRKIIERTIYSFGFNPVQFFYSLRGIPAFLSDYIKISKALSKNSDFKNISISPCTGDRYEQGGDMKSVYFQQDLFVAQHVFKNNPVKHMDIGSRTDGFVAHIASFREIDVIDIRDISSKVKNISFQQSDMMKPNSSLFDKYDSISSLHAIEHFGLGRYGDPINVNGHIAAINNIYDLLKVDGIFYFSVPIGPQRIEFNAHRVFSVRYLLNIFAGKFEVLSFSFIDDNKNLHPYSPLIDNKIASEYGCNYGCGIFILRKISVQH